MSWRAAALFDLAPPVDPAAPAVWFVRCPLCLGVATVPGPEARYFGRDLDCHACGERLEVLGRVQGASLWHGERCPCDERCTTALGPQCSCSCGGKNHGLGLAAAIPHCVGSVPRVRLASAGGVERSRRFKAAAADLRALLCSDPDYRVKAAGGRCDDFHRYRLVRGLLDKLNDAERMRSHHARDRAVERIRAAFTEKGV